MSADIALTFSVERYAEVLAARLHFGVTPEAVLDALGIEAPEWEKIEARWTFELGETKARGQAILAMRFASAYGRARRRLARGEITWADATASVRKATEAAAAAQRVAPSAGESPKVLVPSYLKEGDRAAPPAQDIAVAPPPAAAPPPPAPPPQPIPIAQAAAAPPPAQRRVQQKASPTTADVILTPPETPLPFK
ncbi:MAG TPA: hypothetical protein VL400_23525, partial [Polyangiaceae bacterium]|nr:hypothetical protein [Polyangiaceae bacterium]